jgi:hypothetical protein
MKNIPATNRRWTHVGLGIAVCTGLVLRLYGIQWGLPNAVHPHYSYHPDEMLHLVLGRWLAEGEIIDRHFYYRRTLYFSLLNSYVFFGDRLAGVLGGFNDLANSISFGRYFLVGIATLMIFLVYESARLLLLVILAARFVVDLVDTFPRLKAGTYVLILMVFLWTVLSDLAYLKVEAGRNVRDIASEWLRNNLGAGSSVLVVKTYIGDDYFNPVMPKELNQENFYLGRGNSSRSLFKDRRFDYLILHEHLYKNMERLGSDHPLEEYRQFYQELISSRYRLIKEFRRPVTALGIDFSISFASHDYTIVDPGIQVFKRE